MVLAGLLLFVATYLLLRDREASYMVLTATADIRAGTAVTQGSFTPVRVKLDEQVLAALLRQDEAPGVEGWVAANTIAAGELVSRQDLRAPAAREELRAMSFPIDPQRAVGGELQPGDRIDVISVVGGQSSYVGADLEVIDVASREGGGPVTAPGDFGLTVAVDAQEALALAQALSVGEVTVLRSTGAALVNLAPPLPAQASAPVPTATATPTPTPSASSGG
jgi:Flp pilus assembly protein CpaB